MTPPVTPLPGAAAPSASAPTPLAGAVPGMHSRLEAVRARLDLPVLKRVAGLLEGRHRSILTGHGQDFEELALYLPGDDVGDIDWKATAKAGRPLIRRFERTTDLALVLAVDTGRSMAATAPDGERKSAVAQAVCDVLAYLARARGDLVALVAGDAERMEQLPARGGSAHVEHVLAAVAALEDPSAPVSDPARVLERVLATHPRRSLVVLVTDEARPTPADDDVLARLRARHAVLAVQVEDALPTQLPGAAVRDVEAEEDLPEFLRAAVPDGELATQVRDAVEQRRAETETLLTRRGVPSTRVSGTEDVMDALVRLLTRSRRARL